MKQVLLVLFLVSAGFAQDRPNEVEWTRIDTRDNGISVSFPPGYLVNSEEAWDGDPVFSIFAGGRGIYLRFVASNDVSDRYWSRMKDRAKNKGSEFKVGNVECLSYTSEVDGDGINEAISMRTKKRVYRFSIAARSIRNPDAARFLRSLTIDGKALFPSSEPNSLPETTVFLESLETTPKIAEAMERKRIKQDRKISYHPFSDFVKEEATGQFDEPPIIVDAPRHTRSLYSLARPNGKRTLRGVVRVVLLANGQIGDITVYSDASNSFGRICAAQAKEIRFVPAEKDGESVDSAVVLNYGVILNAR